MWCPELEQVLEKKTVKVWLARERITDNTEGDLIADMRNDIDLPSLFPNIAAMREYLRSRGACPEALAAVPRVWRRYRRWSWRG
jgi:hypothetical protein